MSVEKAKRLDSLKELQKIKSELNSLQNQARGFKTEKEIYTYIDKGFSNFDKDLKTAWSKATIQGKSEFKIYDPKSKQEKIYYIEGPFFITGDKNKFAERSTSTFIKKIELLSQKIDEIFDKNDNIRTSTTGRSGQDISNLKKYTKAIKSHFDIIKNREIGPMKKIFEDMLIKYQNITSGIDAKYKAGSEYLKEKDIKTVKKLSPKGDYYNETTQKIVNGSESYNQAIDSAKILLKGKSGKYMVNFLAEQMNQTQYDGGSFGVLGGRDENNEAYIANYINGMASYIYEKLSNGGDTENLLQLAQVISLRSKLTKQTYSNAYGSQTSEKASQYTKISELASQICVDIISKGKIMDEVISSETKKHHKEFTNIESQAQNIYIQVHSGVISEEQGKKQLQKLEEKVKAIGQNIQDSTIKDINNKAGTNRHNLSTTDVKDLKGSNIEKQAYILYQDINGAGLKLADQTKKNIKMGLTLGGTIAVAMVSIIASGGGTTGFVIAAINGTIANWLLSGKKFGTIKNAVLDGGSELAINVILSRVGGQGITTIKTVSRFAIGGNLTVEGGQLGFGLLDAAANLSAEQLRQKWLGNDINIVDSMTIDNPMSWIIALGIISDSFSSSAIKPLNQSIKNGNTQQSKVLLQKYLKELESHKAELLKNKQIYQIDGKNTTGLDIYNKLVAKTKNLLNNNIDTKIQKVNKNINKTKRQGDKLAGYFDGTAKLTPKEKAIFDKNKNAIMNSGLYDTHTMPGYNNNGKGNLAMSDGRDLAVKRQDGINKLVAKGVSPDDAKAITTKLMDDGVLGIFDWFKSKNTSEYNNINPKIYNRETAKIGIEKVNRSSEVVAIGDLHGEMVAFEGNMKSAGLIDNKGKWSGGNKKIVFHGDILADRGNNSLEIIKKISKLREEAQKQGGDIIVLAGNHEDFLFSFLMSDRHLRGKHGNGLDDSMRDLQGKGLSELAKYIGEKNTDPRIILNEMRKKGNAHIEILNAMRNNLEGKQILEEICKMRLVDQIDDGLFLHTNPTEHILETIRYYSTEADGKINIGKGIDKINTIFQKGLRKNLLGTNESVDTSELNALMDIFLNTNNRRSNTHTSYYNMLKDNGINTIQHGHSGGEEFGGIGEFGGVKIIDNDKSYGKGGDINGDNSISTIKQNGQIEYGIKDKKNIYNINSKEKSETKTVENSTKLENTTTEGSKTNIKSTDTTYNNLNTLLESNEDVFLSQFHDRKNNLTDTQKGELKQSYEAKYPGKTLDISESIVAKEVAETIPEPTKSETIPEVIKIDTSEAAPKPIDTTPEPTKPEVIKIDISETESDPNFVIINKSENISDINTNKDYEIHGEIEQYTNDNVFTKGQKYEVNGVEYAFSGIDKDGIYIFESLKGKLKVKEEGVINMLEKTKKAQEVRKSHSTSAEETIFRENNIAQIDQIITKQKVDLEYKKQISQIDKQIKSYDDKITKNNQDITKLEYEISSLKKELNNTQSIIDTKYGKENKKIIQEKKYEIDKLKGTYNSNNDELQMQLKQNANKEKINKLQQEIDAINNIINRRDNLTKQIENKTNTLNMKKKLVENDHKLRDKLIQQKTDTQDNIYKNIEIRNKTKEIGEAVDNIKLEIDDEIKKKNAELDINKKEFENSEEYQKAGSDEERDELMKKKFKKEEQEIIDLEEDLSKVEEAEELLDPQVIDVDPEIIDVDPELKPIKDSKIQKIQNILSHLKNNKYKYILGGLIGGIIGYNLLSTKKGEDNKYDNEDNESETIIPDSTQAPTLSSPTITDNSPQGTPTDSAEVPPIVTPPVTSNEVNDAEESKSDNEEANSNNEGNKSNNTNTTNRSESTKNNPEPVASATNSSENKANSSTNNTQSENKKESTNSPNSQITSQAGTEALTTISVNANSPTNNKENQNQIEEKVSNIEDLPDMTDEIENYPGQAWAKNNNPAGISRNNNFEKGVGFSAKLKEAGIKFEKGTKRPSGEGNYYVKFDTMGDGIAAQKLFWELKNKTINDVLKSYAVDSYNISGIDGNKKYKDLSEDQKNEFILKQIKRESPGLYKEIIERFDGSSELIANNRIKVRTDDVENIDLSTDNSYIGKDGILYDIKSTSEGSIDVIKNKFSDLVKSAKEYFSIFNVFKHESEYGLDIKRSETREFKNILKKLRKNTEDKDVKDGISIPKIKGYARKPETIPGYDKSLSDQENFDNYIKQLLK